MKARKWNLFGLLVAVAVTAAFVGVSFAARDAGPSTGKELVATYDQLATAILGTRNAETNVVKAICADAWRQARGHLDAAISSLKDGDRGVTAAELESAAESVVLIANEGDKSVAAVRNRLLEGGHHHHATAEIAAKYDPGFVLITKENKKALVAEAGALGKLAARSGELTLDDLEAAGKRVELLYRKAVE